MDSDSRTECAVHPPARYFYSGLFLTAGHLTLCLRQKRGQYRLAPCQCNGSTQPVRPSNGSVEHFKQSEGGCTNLRLLRTGGSRGYQADMVPRPRPAAVSQLCVERDGITNEGSKEQFGCSRVGHGASVHRGEGGEATRSAVAPALAQRLRKALSLPCHSSHSCAFFGAPQIVAECRVNGTVMMGTSRRVVRSCKRLFAL